MNRDQSGFFYFFYFCQIMYKYIKMTRAILFYHGCMWLCGLAMVVLADEYSGYLKQL